MDLIQAMLLGLLQGLTEFLPVSSSGHLVLVPWLLGWPEPGLAFDTMVHLGTLTAVLAFFATDFVALGRGWLGSLRQRKIVDENARMAWLIILATVPAAAIGFLFEDWFESLFMQPLIVGIFLLVTAGLLLAAERLGRQQLDAAGLGVTAALVIGFAQALAICPGISRSGATIAAAMGLGLTRPAAARFSFILAAPIILGSGLAQMLTLLESGAAESQFGLLAAGFITAAVTGYLGISLLLRYVQGRGLQLFAGYCLVAGLATIIMSTVVG